MKEMDNSSSAASQSLQWIVELEQGLRSTAPGARADAILKTGPRLRQWSEEAQSSNAPFDTEPSMERALLSSMLLRLAQAFRSGDNFIRLCILKVLLHEFNWRKGKRGRSIGIFTRERMPNYEEILKSVKEVAETGDSWSRAIALRMFGCFADFAKDRTDILRIAMEALESPHVPVVIGALFAIGCFCEYAEDFSVVVLEKIAVMVNDMKTTPPVKVAAIHLLAKMNCCSAVALKAQEVGRSLTLGLPTKQIVTTLWSLSKLAFISIVTLHDQVGLLLQHLASDPRYIVRATSLKCIYKLSSKVLRCMPFQEKLVTALLNVFNETCLPSSVHCYAIQILQKLCRHYVFFMDACQLSKFVSYTEISCLHPELSIREASLTLMVELICSIERRMKYECDEITKVHLETCLQSKHLSTETSDVQMRSNVELPVCVSLMVFDQVTLALRSARENKNNFPIKCGTSFTMSKCFYLRFFILKLIEESPASRLSIIDCIKNIFDSIFEEGSNQNFEQTIQVKPRDSEHGMAFNQNENHHEVSGMCLPHFSMSDLIGYLCHSLLKCLHKLDVDGTLDTRIFKKVKHIAEWMVKIDLYRNFAHYALSALFRAHYSICCRLIDEKEIDHDKNASNDNILRMRKHLFKVQDYGWAQHEALSLQTTRNLIKASRFWEVYKIGIVAACEGAWIAATEIFECLNDKPQSESCHLWLKSLFLSAKSEKGLVAILLPSHGRLKCPNGNPTDLDHISGSNSELVDDSNIDIITRYIEAKASVLEPGSAALNSLPAFVTKGTFEFQWRFLKLRYKLLKNVYEVLETVKKSGFDFNDNQRQNISAPFFNKLPHQPLLRLRSLKSVLIPISIEFRTIATEFDLLNTSFMDIDDRSSRNLSITALVCSMLSFFCFFVVCLPKLDNTNLKTDLLLNDFETSIYESTIQDLVQRLEKTECNKRSELISFFGCTVDAIHPLAAMTCIRETNSQEKLITSLCSESISEVLNLHKQVAEVTNQWELEKVLQSGLKLLAEFLLNWLHIPWQLPRYFFCVRKRVGVKLFSSVIGKKVTDGISVKQGLQLPLNVQIQLKNISRKRSIQVQKVFSILYACPIGISCNGAHQFYRDQRLEDIKEQLDLTQELWVKAFSEEAASMAMKEIKYTFSHLDSEHIGRRKTTFVALEIGDDGKGSGTCLLDISTLQCGWHKIYFLCACMDNRDCFWNLQCLNSGRDFQITS